MKKAIVTVCIGNRYEEIAKITHPTIKQYAEKIGAEFIVINQPSRYPHWEKFELYNLLIKYNRIIYLDTDIIVRDDCPDLFEMIPETKIGLFNEGRFASREGSLLEACKHYEKDIEKYDGTYFNSGVMVISRQHRSLFKIPSKVVSLGMFEQGYLNMILLTDFDVEKDVEELDYKFNRMTILDSFCGIHRLDSYIVHYAGAPQNMDLTGIIKGDLENWAEKKPKYEYERHVIIYAGGGMGDQLSAEPVVRYAIENFFKDVKTNFMVISNWPRFFTHLGVTCMTREEYDTKKIFDTPMKILKTIPAPEESTIWHNWSHINGHTVDYAAVCALHKTLPDDAKNIKLDATLEGLTEAVDICGFIPDNMILVHPGRGWASKTFPASWWYEVIEKLIKNGEIVGVIGKHISDKQGFIEMELPEGAIDFRNLLSLDGLISLISIAKLVISNDSAPIHIAGAFDNNILLIATCRHPDFILPYRKNANKHYKAFAFAKKLTIDDWDLSPTRIFKESADIIKGNILDYIPTPDEVVQKSIEFNEPTQKEKEKEYKEKVFDFIEKTEILPDKNLTWNDQYEPEVQEIIKKYLKPGDNFIDIGANAGVFSLLASSLIGKDGIVYAFEPEDHSYRRLCNNIKEFINVKPIKKAVGNECKNVELFFNYDNDSGHSLWNPSLHPLNPITKNNESIKESVEMVTLDSFDEINVPIKMIKTDTEGCEMLIMKGAENILKKYHPYVVSEIHTMALEEMGSSKKEYYDYMLSLGYKSYRLPEEEEFNLSEEPITNKVYNIVFKYVGD